MKTQNSKSTTMHQQKHTSNQSLLPMEMILRILSFLPLPQQYEFYKYFYGEKEAKRELKRNGCTIFIGKQLELYIREVLVYYKLKKVPTNSFNNSKIKTIVFPEGVEEIDTNAFINCPYLDFLNIPKTLKRINGCFLNNCGNNIDLLDLSSVPMETLSYNFIHSCFINTLILPLSLKRIDMRTITFSNINKLVISGNRKMCLFKDAFLLTHIAELDLSKANITCLNSSTFLKANIDSIILPEVLHVIGTQCFAESAIKSIIIPKSVEYIEKKAFNRCMQLKNVIFNNKINSIPKYCFAGCHFLKGIYFKYPSEITTIEEKAFVGCANLISLNLGESIEIIEEGAFLETLRLQVSFKFPMLNSLGIRAFEMCGIKHIELSKHINIIPVYCFKQCRLETIVCYNIEKICTSAFENCVYLKSFKFSDTITEIERRAFFKTLSLEEVKLPKNLEVINSETFAESGIQKLVLPEKLNKIGFSAFSNIQIKTLDLPKNTKLVDNWAFLNSSRLRKVIINSKNTIISKLALSNQNKGKIERVLAYQ